MGKLIRRDKDESSGKSIDEIIDSIDDKTKTKIIARSNEQEKARTNLTLFPGAKKDKGDIQIDPERMEALKKWRAAETKDYKVKIPDPGIKNPSFQRMAQALIDCDGFIMKAAISLGITYNRFNKLIKLNPKLKEIVTDTTEALLDLAENKLKDKIIAGDLTATIFFLKSKGGMRGWRDADSSTPIVGNDKPVSFNYNLVLPPGCRLVNESGTEVYSDKTGKKEEQKQIESIKEETSRKVEVSNG